MNCPDTWTLLECRSCVSGMGQWEPNYGRLEFGCKLMFLGIVAPILCLGIDVGTGKRFLVLVVSVRLLWFVCHIWGLFLKYGLRS